jgi:hypothetical protein
VARALHIQQLTRDDPLQPCLLDLELLQALGVIGVRPAKAISTTDMAPSAPPTPDDQRQKVTPLNRPAERCSYQHAIITLAGQG